MRRLPGIRPLLGLFVVAAFIVPVVAEGVAFARLDDALDDAEQSNARHDVEETQDMVDGRLREARDRAREAGVLAPAAAVNETGEWTWVITGGAIVARTPRARASLDDDALALAASGRAFALAPRDGPVEGAFASAAGPIGHVVIFRPASELLQGTPGGRLARETSGFAVAPLATTEGAVVMDDPPDVGDDWGLFVVGVLGLTIGAAALVAVVLTWTVVRPLRDLEAAASAFAAGRRESRAPVGGAAEAASLAERFNRMADELVRSEEDLVARARTLESEISHLEFAADHDFRERLRSIAVLSKHVLDTEATRLDADACRALASCIGEAEHLEQVAADVRRILEAGRRPLAPLATSVAEAAREAAGEETAVRVSGDAMALADPGALVEALREIVRNGLKFNESPEPRVDVRIRSAGGRAVIEVEDNGIGVPRAMRGEIRKPFRRLHPRGRYPGTGAGLAVAERLVARQGGTLEFDHAPSGGTIVEVTLPAAPYAP